MKSNLSLCLLPGVGGIETEAVMLGMPVTLTLPEVVGCELTGAASPLATSIDIVLSITKVRVCLFKQSKVCCKFYQWWLRTELHAGSIFSTPLIMAVQ